MWTSLYSESVATAKNLRALDFAQEKIKNIAPYIHFPNPKSSIEGEMTCGLEQKTRIGTFYLYERESVAFYLNHLRVPSSRYVRLVRRFHDEWKSDGQCAPIVLQVSLPAAFYQSASGFTRWPLPALFSCRWFAKRRRAEEPLRRRPNYIIPPFFFSQWKRRRDPWKGISFIFFLSFAFSCFHSSLSLLIPNIEQRYPRKRKTEIAITACLIFDES